MQVTHNQPPEIEAIYTYFIRYNDKDYIYQRRETNVEAISELFDEEKEEWISYEEQSELIDFLDQQFEDQTLHDLDMTETQTQEDTL